MLVGGGTGRLAAQRLEQHVREGGESQPQLIDVEGVRGESIGKEFELRLLDAVLHLAAGTVEVFVEFPGGSVALL